MTTHWIRDIASVRVEDSAEAFNGGQVLSVVFVKRDGNEERAVFVTAPHRRIQVPHVFPVPGHEGDYDE